MLSLSSSVFSFVCPFFSFSVLGFCSAFFLVLKCFNRVSRKCKGCLKFQWCFKEISRIFQGSFQGGYRKFQGCFKGVKRVFQGSFMSVIMMIQGNFNGVSKKF